MSLVALVAFAFLALMIGWVALVLGATWRQLKSERDDLRRGSSGA